MAAPGQPWKFAPRHDLTDRASTQDRTDRTHRRDLAGEAATTGRLSR